MAPTIPIRVEIFERAFKRYHKSAGTSFTALAKKMKVPAAHLREWRRTGKVPADKLEILAAALDIDPARLMRSDDGEISQERSSALKPSKVGHNLLTVARTLRSYTQFLGYHRVHPHYSHFQSVHHSGKEAFYGTLFIESSASKQEWLFSVWFGLRMDYGIARLNGDREVQLQPILQEQDPGHSLGFATENDEGKLLVCVRTWFGRPSCDFIVQSERPFSMRWTRAPVVVPGAVTFVKNPFQRDE